MRRARQNERTTKKREENERTGIYVFLLCKTGRVETKWDDSVCKSCKKKKKKKATRNFVAEKILYENSIKYCFIISY